MSDEIKITATWCLSLECECPSCFEFVNLIEADDFWDGKPSNFACEHNTDIANNLHVICPECDYEFNVCCEY